MIEFGRSDDSASAGGREVIDTEALRVPSGTNEHPSVRSGVYGFGASYTVTMFKARVASPHKSDSLDFSAGGDAGSYKGDWYELAYDIARFPDNSVRYTVTLTNTSHDWDRYLSLHFEAVR